MLELLSDGGRAVAEMLPLVGIESAHLSRQLTVLRRANLVTSRKEGRAACCSLSSPHVAELLAVARRILTGVLPGQAGLLHDLRPLRLASGRVPGCGAFSWLRAADRFTA